MSRLSMRKISEILRQRYELKRSYRDVAQSLNISISTVATYLTCAKKANISWPLPSNLDEQELQDRIFLPTTQSEFKKPLPDFEKIHQEYRKKGVTLRLLWREYRDTYPDGLSYNRYCIHYRVFAKTIEPVMRQVHKAGEKTFVDYAGTTVEWIDPATGEINYAQIFVGTLGASQLIFCEATETHNHCQIGFHHTLICLNILAVLPILWCQIISNQQLPKRDLLFERNVIRRSILQDYARAKNSG